MSKLKKKIISGTVAFATITSIVVPAFSTTVLAAESDPNIENVSNITETSTTLMVDDLLDVDLSNLTKEDQRQLDVAEALSNYFVEREDGSAVLEVDALTLVNDLDLTEEEAQAILQTSDEFSEGVNQTPNRQRGFVGLHINLGAKTRKMGAWAAGAYVGGYIGFQLKVFATTPATAGVVAVISGSVVWVVKQAVEKGIRRVSVGANIPYVAKAFNVNTP